MNLKTIIAKVVSWFKGEVTSVEMKIIRAADGSWALSKNGALQIIPEFIEKELDMSTPAAAAPAAITAPNQVNTAVQIALALKAIDASLCVDAVQAATNAALAALYPTTA